jgi:outer membrane protein
MKPVQGIILIGTLLAVSVQSFGQERDARMLTMQGAFDLAIRNSAQLKVSELNTELARQKMEIVKLEKLPEISSGLNYGYLGDIQAWDPSFGEHTTVPTPHNFTQFSVTASEVIFRGGEVANSIAKATLEEQVAVLIHHKNLEDIKFLVAATYLDIYRLINQRKVYADNILLSFERLENILSLQKQGLVTNNDVLRTKLIISDLELAVHKIDDNIKILNQRFNMVLGLDLNERLIPDTTLLAWSPRQENIEKLLADALQNNKELKTAAKEIEISQTNLKLIGADRYPRVSLFATNSLQRPFTYSIPPRDICFNFWVAGVSISYSISSTYQSPRKTKAGTIQLEQALAKETLQKQNVEVTVNADLIKFNEAQFELATYTEDMQSAEENYRIVGKRYFNQLALLADLIDATNTKIEAEIKVSNARINVVFAQYQLKKSIGLL